MDLLKKLFPFSFAAKDVNGLVVAIVVYFLLGLACAIVSALLFLILPFLWFLIPILSGAVGLYFIIGIVLTVLTYFNLLTEDGRFQKPAPTANTTVPAAPPAPAADPAAPVAPVAPVAPAAEPAPAADPAPEAPAFKFCTNCGTKLAADAKFCAGCGTKQ